MSIHSSKFSIWRALSEPWNYWNLGAVCGLFSWGSCRDHGWFCSQSSEGDSTEISAVVLYPGFSLESTGKIMTSLVWGGTLVTAFAELLRWVRCAASIENRYLIQFAISLRQGLRSSCLSASDCTSRSPGILLHTDFNAGGLSWAWDSACLTSSQVMLCLCPRLHLSGMNYSMCRTWLPSAYERQWGSFCSHPALWHNLLSIVENSGHETCFPLPALPLIGCRTNLFKVLQSFTFLLLKQEGGTGWGIRSFLFHLVPWTSRVFSYSVGIRFLCGRPSRFYSKDPPSSSDRAYLGLSLGSLEKVRLINVKKLKRLMLNCKL